MTPACVKCGKVDELRGGVCWDCADAAEAAAYYRTVWQHLAVGLPKLLHPSLWWQMRFDLRWAWERLTRTGDYKAGGYFEREHGKR